jgi:hypothetical protein
MHDWISIQFSLLGLLYGLKDLMEFFSTNAISYCVLYKKYYLLKVFLDCQGVFPVLLWLKFRLEVSKVAL